MAVRPGVRTTDRAVERPVVPKVWHTPGTHRNRRGGFPMRFSRVLLPAVLAFSTVSFAFAAPQHRETTTVEVVQVPVYVTTAGASVRGLTRDDFTLRVNGKVQPIEYFDVVDFTAMSKEQLSDPRQRRLYVLVFDLPNTNPFAMYRAKRAAEEYLANAQPSDYFAVALANRYGDINFVVPFTRDRNALRRAVATFHAASPKDPLALTVTPAERAAFTFDNTAEIEQLRHMGANEAADQMIQANLHRVADEMDALGNLAQRMAPLEGYKHVVVLSGGFGQAITPIASPGVPSILRRNGEPQLAAYRNPIRFDSYTPFSQRLMQKKFAASGVFLDAIDVTGLRPYDVPSDDSLHFLVADTGGQVVEHRNDLRAAMQRLTDSQEVVYVLGFHPPSTGRTQNQIAVRVTGAPRGSNIGYRESYSTTMDKVSSRDGLQLADIIINDIPQNGLTLKTAVTTAPKRATVNATLSGRELLALAGDDKLTGEALMYVFSGQTSVAFARKGITIDGARARAGGLDQNDIAIAQSFDLPPGNYTMKVLVRIDGRDALALSREDFTVKE
jgi:VWFA-related protein